MIYLVLGVIGVLGGGTGWLAWKASARLATWGRNMDECDQIFQMMSEEEPDSNSILARSRIVDPRKVRPSVTSHFPAGAAPLK